MKIKKVVDCSRLPRLFPIFLRKLWICKILFMMEVKMLALGTTLNSLFRAFGWNSACCLPWMLLYNLILNERSGF